MAPMFEKFMGDIRVQQNACRNIPRRKASSIPQNPAQSAPLQKYEFRFGIAAQAKVDVFLTTDDGIQKIANRKKAIFSFAIANPVRWLE